MTWNPSPSDVAWLDRQGRSLLDFGRAAAHPDGGFGWLNRDGVLETDRPVALWITARMTHCYALGELLGHDGSADLVEHGLQALTARLHDDRYGGWYAAVGPHGPEDATKETYGHAFVVLAASSALHAGHPSAKAVLSEALEVFEAHLWSETDGLVVDQWDRSFRTLDPYRGLNANMHSVEAFLAAGDATGDHSWSERALRIARRALGSWAPAWQWRLPEHFSSDWSPQPDYHRDQPADPFRPFGSTPGHGLEWARLALSLAAGHPADAVWLTDAARRLVQRATADGWSVDGAPGFVYTVDWDGRPVVAERMHWVAAEATAVAASLAKATGDAHDVEAYDRWWQHVRSWFVDADGGSWWHELDRAGRPSATVWPGKPDIYHALQATLIPRLPLGASLAGGLAAGALDRSPAATAPHALHALHTPTAPTQEP